MLCGLTLKHRLHCCFYRPQTKFAKAMFSQVSVCPRGRRRVCLPGIHILHGTHNPPPPKACTPPRHTQPSRHAHTSGMHAPKGHARPPQILRDALNERPVRILLECILVFIKVYILFAKCKRNNCNHISHFVGRLWQKF